MNHVYQASKWIFPDETAEKSENRGGQLGHRATWEKNEKFTPRVIYGDEHDARRKIGKIDLKDTFPKMALWKSQKTPKKTMFGPAATEVSTDFLQKLGNPSHYPEY